MDEGKKGFILFLNFLPMIDALTDEEAGRLIKAIMHHENGEEIDLTNDRLVQAAYLGITPQIDLQNEKWEKTKEARREAGRRGGIAKVSNAKQTLANVSNAKQTLANVSNAKQTLANDSNAKQTLANDSNAKHKVKVKVKDKVKVEVKENKSGQAAPVRHHFGANGKVLLTDDDLEKLYEAHGQEDTMAAIEIMDGYLTANGRSYKNYRQALENWAYRAVEEKKQKGIQAKKYNNGEFPQTDLSEQLQAVEDAMLERQGAKRA